MRERLGYTDDETHTPVYLDRETGLVWFGCGFVPMEGDDD